MRCSTRASAVVLLAAGVVGCATFAKPTPTPAAKLTREQLENPPQPPNEKYYAVVFGAQRVPYARPALTHTWATAVRATWQPGCAEPTVEAFTISWLPATLVVNPRRYHVEPGRNLTLPETLAWAYGNGMSVDMWGPYELRTSVFRRFLIQKEFLESGAVGYQCVDTVGEAAREGNGCDCIHAISDLDPQFDRTRYPLVFYGKPASRRLVHEAARREAFVDPWTEHDWVIPAIGLDKYPITRRPQPYAGIRPPIDPDRPRSFPLARRW